MPRKKKTLSFEGSLEELENLVETLEKGELTLEDTLKSFERGVELTRHCQDALKTVEQKVRILTENTSESELDDFTPHE